MEDYHVEDVLELLMDLQKEMTKDDVVSLANAVMVDKKIKDSIKHEYVERFKERFSGELFASKTIIEDVNAWVKDKTKGMIDSIADESMRDMIFCLVNAINFEAEWKDEYKDTDISERNFTNVDGTQGKVSMLESTEDSYVENQFCTSFVKPYKGTDYSFMALLPKKDDHCVPSDMVSNMDFTKLFKERTDETVSVMMSEYKYGMTFDMEQPLKKWVLNAYFQMMPISLRFQVSG